MVTNIIENDVLLGHARATNIRKDFMFSFLIKVFHRCLWFTKITLHIQTYVLIHFRQHISLE